ncbi:MAG: hypothetical protein ACFFED_08755 [Candidatus Thorarchaeota archaeon]
MSDEPNDSYERKERRRKGSDEAEELREIAKALPELFNAINDSIPKMISGIISSVYSPEAAGNMGTAVGQFYSKLIEEGIPEPVALEMTKKFVGALDFEKLIGMVTSEVDSERKGKGRRRMSIKWDDEDEDEEFDNEE